MSFIVEVTRRKADDPELSFNNLEMFHQNCFGGKIVYYTREGMRDHQQCLKCERCDSGVIVDRDKLWDSAEGGKPGKRAVNTTEDSPW